MATKEALERYLAQRGAVGSIVHYLAMGDSAAQLRHP